MARSVRCSTRGPSDREHPVARPFRPLDSASAWSASSSRTPNASLRSTPRWAGKLLDATCLAIRLRDHLPSGDLNNIRWPGFQDPAGCRVAEQQGGTARKAREEQPARTKHAGNSPDNRTVAIYNVDVGVGDRHKQVAGIPPPPWRGERDLPQSGLSRA